MNKYINNIEYVQSEKIWRAPELEFQSCGLGEAYLEKLKNINPEKVIEVFHDNGTHVTAKELRDQIITAAQNLLNLEVKKDDTVVFFTMLNLKITPLTIACYTIGAPVCFFETYLQDEHTPQYLELLDPAVIFYEEKFKSKVFKALEKLNLSNLKHIFSLDGQHKSAEEFLFKPTVDIESFQAPNIGDPKALPAVLAFTSGTTGLPKITVNSHDLQRNAFLGRWQAEPGSVVMILSEIRWSCQIGIMMQPAFLDVKRIYSSKPPMELTGEMVKDMIDTHKVTHFFEVPKFYQTVLEAAERSKDPSSLSSLKLVMLGGESAGEEFEAYFAKLTPDCQLVRGYGMTEVGGNIVSSQTASKQNVNGGVLRKSSMVKIIDKDKNSLGPNEMGIICLKTTAPFLGYLKNKVATEETFIEGGWLNTGDLGMVDSENLLHVYTREKYSLKYADGKILIPNVVENIVCKFEGVHSSVLVGIPSMENPKQDCGTIFVVLKSNTHSIYFENNLREYLKNKLTREQLEIVKYIKVIEDLPKTTCSKVDRAALKEMFDGGYRI